MYLLWKARAGPESSLPGPQLPVPLELTTERIRKILNQNCIIFIHAFQLKFRFSDITSNYLSTALYSFSQNSILHLPLRLLCPVIIGVFAYKILESIHSVLVAFQILVNTSYLKQPQESPEKQDTYG